MAEHDKCDLPEREHRSEPMSRASSGPRQACEKATEWSRQKWATLGERQRIAREKLQQRSADLKQRMRGGVQRVRGRADEGRDRASQIMEDYPLAVGVSAMALGILIGLALPTTRRERRYLGESGRRLREQGRQGAREALERGKEIAETTGESVKEEAQRQGLTPEGIKESAHEIARDTGEVAQQHMQEMGEKVESVAEAGKDTLEEEAQRERERLG